MASAVSKASTAPDAAAVKNLLSRALAPRMGETSGRFLGRADMIDAWSDEKVGALVRGLGVAQTFYPMFPPTTLARLVIAEGAQESTGDSNLNVPGKPGDGQGFMQVTPQSVVKDFLWFGQPLTAPDGSVVVDPGDAGNIDLGRVDQNVALWAWYTRNSVGSRQSLAQRILWANTPVEMRVDFGNAQLTWLAGPGNDRHTPAGAANFRDYHLRISDYFHQSGFDDEGQTYDQLLDTPLGEDLVLAALRPGRTAADWQA